MQYVCKRADGILYVQKEVRKIKKKVEYKKKCEKS